MIGGSHNSVSHCLGVDSFSFPFSPARTTRNPSFHATREAATVSQTPSPSSHFRRRSPAGTPHAARSGSAPWPCLPQSLCAVRALRTVRALLPPVPARTPHAARPVARRPHARTPHAARCLLRRAAAGCCWLLLLRRVKNSAARLLQFQFQSPLAPSPAVLLLGFFGFFSCLLRFTCCSR